MMFNAKNQTGYLSIETRFSECGEWGGHKEQIIIQADSDNSFHANYTVFPYDCDSLPYYIGINNLKPIINKTVAVNDKEKKSILDYVQRLMQSKIDERAFDGATNAGNIFTLTNSDSSLFISLYNNKLSDIESYKQLITELYR
jgi:hypothetical protein